MVEHRSFDETSRRIEEFQSKEYFEFIGQLGFIHPGRIQLIYDSMDTGPDINPALKTLVLIGKAKIDTLMGRFYAAKDKFDQAERYAHDTASQESFIGEDPRAYLNYELGAYHTFFDAQAITRGYLREALSQANTNRLKFLIEYNLEVMRLWQGESQSLRKLNHYLKLFKKRSMTIMYCSSLFTRGKLYNSWGQYDNAENSLQEGLQVADENGLQYLYWNIKNSLGLSRVRTQGLADGRSYLLGILDEIETPYLRTLVTRNIAKMSYELKEYELSESLLKKSLEECYNNDVIIWTPAIHIFLAEMYEELGKDLSTITYHYTQATKEVMKFLNDGFPLAPMWRSALKQSTEFTDSLINERYAPNLIADAFRFAIGKSWKEIKDIFQFNLVYYHFFHTGVGQPSFERLGLSRSTFYALVSRLEDRGIYLPPLRKFSFEEVSRFQEHHLQRYIAKYPLNNWEEMNHQFERDIIEYLYKLSGYSKRRLSENLEMSYSVVIAKTKQITNPGDPED